MYEISAAHFGESMLSFYHDMIAYYETERPRPGNRRRRNIEKIQSQIEII